jgi:hypothetical protein
MQPPRLAPDHATSDGTSTTLGLGTVDLEARDEDRPECIPVHPAHDIGTQSEREIPRW